LGARLEAIERAGVAAAGDFEFHFIGFGPGQAIAQNEAVFEESSRFECYAGALNGAPYD
jgi:hypothetical protein